jgi:hypothetical protein
MDEIIAHPWVQGDVPTQEEVFTEMTTRKLGHESEHFNKNTNTH